MNEFDDTRPGELLPTPRSPHPTDDTMNELPEERAQELLLTIARFAQEAGPRVAELTFACSPDLVGEFSALAAAVDELREPTPVARNRIRPPYRTSGPYAGTIRQLAITSLRLTAELIDLFRLDDAEAVDYYHLSDISAEGLRDDGTNLLDAVAACGPSFLETAEYANLEKALSRLPSPDHPLNVFRRVWTRWQGLPARGADGMPLPVPDPVVDRLLTEAGVEPAPTQAGGNAPAQSDMAAENARLRHLLAELILEGQRRKGYHGRFFTTAPEDASPETRARTSALERP